MEVEFGNLLKARRGKEVFYSFPEAREKFFSSIRQDTLNNALEYLGEETLAHNKEERIFSKNNFHPHQTGPVRLIGELSLLCLCRQLRCSMQFHRTLHHLGISFHFH